MKQRVLWVLLLCPWSVQARDETVVVRHIIRDVQLDPSVRQASVTVVGAPGVTTSIRLPDSFKAENVLCGECLEVRPGEAEATAAATDNPRLWVIEKRVAEQAIHLRPHKQPSDKLLPHAFGTNVFIGLDGGYSINVTVHMVDIEPGKPPAADAIVDLKLPLANTFAGRMAEERAKMYAQNAAKMQTDAMQLLIHRISGDVQCRRLSWRRPYTADRMVVRLNQLCSSTGDEKTYWVTFEAENRGAGDLYLESATLEPESAVKTVADEAPYGVPQQPVPFQARVKGAALRTLAKDVLVPSTWRLRVTPASPDREPVVIENLVF